MEMLKKYEKPELDITFFEIEDIVTTSDVCVDYDDAEDPIGG